MRTWTYTYKTSDGLHHEAEMSAPCKDDVYKALRERGIRAIRVTERIQPIVRKGFSGLRKRDWSLVAVGICAVAVAAVVLFDRKSAAVVEAPGGKASERTVDPVVGSPVVQVAQPRPRKWIDLPPDTDFSKVFRHPHEACLACFALPGVAVTNRLGLTPRLVADFYDNLNAAVLIESDDSAPIAELKRIVAGMKDDAKKYLGVPNGIERLVDGFVSRQTMECEYRERVVSDAVKRKGKPDYAAVVASADRLLEMGGFAKTGLKKESEEK